MLTSNRGGRSLIWADREGSRAQGSSRGCCPQGRDRWMRVLGWGPRCWGWGISKWSLHLRGSFLMGSGAGAGVQAGVAGMSVAIGNHCKHKHPQRSPFLSHRSLDAGPLPGKEKFLQNPPCWPVSPGHIPPSGSPKPACSSGIVPDLPASNSSKAELVPGTWLPSLSCCPCSEGGSIPLAMQSCLERPWSASEGKQ